MDFYSLIQTIDTFYLGTAPNYTAGRYRYLLNMSIASHSSIQITACYEVNING